MQSGPNGTDERTGSRGGYGDLNSGRPDLPQLQVRVQEVGLRGRPVSPAPACSEPRPQNAAIREAAGEEGAVPPLPQAQSPKKAQPFPGPLWGASVGVLLWGPHRLPNPSQDSVAVLCVWAPRSREHQLARPPLPGPRRDSELAGWVQEVRELAPHHSLSWAHAGWPAGSVGGFGIRRLLRKGCRHAAGGRLRTGLAGTVPPNLLEPWAPLAGGRWREEGPGRDPAEATASPACPHHSRATPSMCLPRHQGGQGPGWSRG